MRRSLREHFLRRVLRWSGHQLEHANLLVIEPTNQCNRQCPICGAAVSADTRPSGYMDWDMFVALAEQAATFEMKTVHLYAHGEPMMHPRLCDMVRTLVDLGVRPQIVTNGDLLTAQKAHELAEAGLGEIVISHPNVSPVNYQTCRGSPPPPDIDERLTEFIRACHQKGLSASIQCMVIKQVLSKGAEETSDFLRKWLNVPGVKDVIFHGYIPWPRHFREDMLLSVMSGHGRCGLGMRSLVVFWDGTITPCSYDVGAELALGRFPQLSLGKAYNCAKMREFRREWLRRHERWPAVCRGCLIPRCPSPTTPISAKEFHEHMNRTGPKQKVWFGETAKATLKQRTDQKQSR